MAKFYPVTNDNFPTQAQLCNKAQFTSDQLENMGAVYRELSNGWGWEFSDGSKGKYICGNEFIILED